MREAARPNCHTVTLAQSHLTSGNAQTASHACCGALTVFCPPACGLPVKDLKAGVFFWPGSFPGSPKRPGAGTLSSCNKYTVNSADTN
jgi:hypothetical protein